MNCTQPTQLLARKAFTLVEVLVVIAIIGTLVGLLLPAVQAARESARRTACINKLKQVSLACLSHEQALQHYPCGGWGWGWEGDPDQGFGLQQPGGWVFNILPYIEQVALRDLGRGESDAQKRLSRQTLVQTPLAVFNCPTRRPVMLFEYFSLPINEKTNMDPCARVARGDYAINAGSQTASQIYVGPPTFAQGMDPNYAWPDTAECSGISYQRSQVKHSQITDGVTKTYLLGERNVNPAWYYSGEDLGDNSNLYTGHENDNHRCTHEAPAPDTRGVMLMDSFGSAHSAICNFAICDGSVRSISYGIDPQVHRNLGNRSDGVASSSGSY